MDNENPQQTRNRGRWWPDRKETRKPDRRSRGIHSTACLCPLPHFEPDPERKRLPGELGNIYDKLARKDAVTGKTVIKKRLSLSAHFVLLRGAVGRLRHFREERRNLLDALALPLLEGADLATSFCRYNISQLAENLSGENGERVTVPRVSRLLQDLVPFGLVELPGLKWDRVEKTRLPQHVILTEKFFELCGANMDRLRRHQSEALAADEIRAMAEAKGYVLPGDSLTLKAAREWWRNTRLHEAIAYRRNKSRERKAKGKIATIENADNRKHAIAELIRKEVKLGLRKPLSDAEYMEAIDSYHRDIHRIRKSKVQGNTPPLVLFEQTEIPY